MEFKIGEPMFLCGAWSKVRDSLYESSLYFLNNRKKVIFIDTLNNLDPHSKLYRCHLQKQLFRSIYCARSEMPYDLLARLKTSGNFIENKRIKALLVTSLTILFKDSQDNEIAPLLNNILEIICDISKKHDLVTLIGVSPYPDEKVMKAAAILLGKENVVMV